MNATTVATLVIIGMLVFVTGGLAGFFSFKAIDGTQPVPPVQPTGVSEKDYQAAQQRISDLSNQVSTVEAQKKRLEQELSNNQILLQELQTAPQQPLSQSGVELSGNEELIKSILRDQTKLTLQNCDAVVDYAEDKEDDLDDEIKDANKDLAKERERLTAYNADLVQAGTSGDTGEIRRINDKIDRTEDDIDDLEDDIEDLEDDYDDIKRLRVKAEYQCRRLDRAF